jgi:Fis family transcriptional regulator, factor for inversion stimulation protein
MSANHPPRHDLSAAVVCTLEQYFLDLDGESPSAVYEMVLRCVEKPMLEVIMSRTSGNQSQAADILGINRNTLRKKLTDYQLL